MNFDENDTLRYLENRLSGKEKIQFEKELLKDTELRELLDVMQLSQLPYESAFTSQEKGNDTAPKDLYDFLDQTHSLEVNQERNLQQSNDNVSHPKFGLFKIAGFALTLFVAGFLSHSFIGSYNHHKLLSMYGHEPEIFESIAIYQSLYARDTIEKVNQSNLTAQALLTSFNAKNDVDIKLPDLSSYGFEFRRVQQLIFEGQPLLQFVYLGEEGEPVAICVVPARKIEASQKNLFATEFSGMNVIQANGHDSTYIIVSKEPLAVLKKLPNEISFSL